MSEFSDIRALLEKKKRGQELSEKEINDFVQMSSKRIIGESQIGAMLMAIAIQKLTSQETLFLTKAMIKSGECLKWNEPMCDKHSTGGVGDKISIPLAPALASLGMKVPMLSGRGLAITGGTLDKLESIPGYRVNLSTDELKHCIEKCGVFIASTTDDICPGDKVIYAIRDVTATVDVDELVVSSILSKKAAAGVNHLVLDLKVGRATFYTNIEDARKLALKMKTKASQLGMSMTVFLTRMDDPLGQYVGNSLEIEECIQILKGQGTQDVKELVCILGGQLLAMNNKAKSPEEGAQMMDEVLKNGKAMKSFHNMLIHQGVDPPVADELCYGNYKTILPQAAMTTDIQAQESGWVEGIDALAVATVVLELGGGRKLAMASLDLTVGVVIHKKRGSQIKEGDCWLTVHHNKPLQEVFKVALERALRVTSKSVPATFESLVLEMI